MGEVLRVSIPATMTQGEEDHWVSEMIRRANRWSTTESIDLQSKGRALAERFGLPMASGVAWSYNQNSRWGSCTPTEGSIRISSHLAGMPDWVLDYVIVHELSHLVVPTHGPDFWELANRYPRTERARGYLMAKSIEPMES